MESQFYKKKFFLIFKKSVVILPTQLKLTSFKQSYELLKYSKEF